MVESQRQQVRKQGMNEVSLSFDTKEQNRFDTKEQNQKGYLQTSVPSNNNEDGISFDRHVCSCDTDTFRINL
jgi:hypothetical protein